MSIRNEKLNVIVILFLGSMVSLTTFLVVRSGNLDIRDEAKKVQKMDSQCNLADINGEAGTADGKVNGYDLSKVLANWKWKKEPKDSNADIWGKGKAADGNVDMFDISRILYCWRLTRPDLPARCGDGKVDSGEECDPPGESGQCSNGTCGSDCKCSASSSTTTGTSTTGTTTIPPVTTTTTVAPTTSTTTAQASCTCKCKGCGLGYGCMFGICGEGWSCEQNPPEWAETSFTATPSSECTIANCTPKLWDLARAACEADPNCEEIRDMKEVSANCE